MGVRDAEQPWLWPYGRGPVGFDSSLSRNAEVARVLNERRALMGSAVPEFKPSTDTLGALAYERCVHSGYIPTRDLGHDWYNGQVWLAFPQSKHFINTSHVNDACHQVVQSANGRSRLRDALTLFDESGAVLLTTDAQISTALQNHDWNHLFVSQRERWSERVRVLVFGHGLLDSMDRPHKGLCAKAIPVCVPDLSLAIENLTELVLTVIRQIQDPANLSPLPVMGIPGWFRESEVPGYYDDGRVFRAKPTQRIGSLHERLAFVWDGSTLVVGKCAGQSLPETQGEESPDSSEHGAG